MGACATVPENAVTEQAQSEVRLVIAGGGLARDTEDVWMAFISSARETGSIVIVPSASGSPASSAEAARETFTEYGVAPERVEIARLALLDDDTTQEIDESSWRENARDPLTAAILENAAGIWFTGGDQSRTTELLYTESGQDTAVLSAIKQAQASGALLGGTSAGAAIMSDPMITQGETLPTLVGSETGERLALGTGLGFFSSGLVDQHFGERARLGRLAVALMQMEAMDARIGYGIDEDTALVVYTDGTLRVAGNGYVTVLDARRAKLKPRGDASVEISGLNLHLLAKGDAINAETLAVSPASWKTATIGNEYVETSAPGGGGMALAGQTLPEVIGNGLIDNKADEKVQRISFNDEGRGIAYVFTQLPQSEGYWGRGPDGEGRYAIANIKFDITPILLSIETQE